MSARPIDYVALQTGAPTADAHAHLDMLTDPVAALVDAGRAGVALIATVVDVSEDVSTFDALDVWRAKAGERLVAEGVEGAAVPDVCIVAGVHPHNASVARRAEGDLLARLRDPRVAALGEAGLDYHYEHSPRAEQRAAFERHLAMAHEAALPVIVHLRGSHDDGHDILTRAGLPSAGCVIHCFTEDTRTAERFLELGCFISFAGVTTFKKSHAVREAVRMVPLDRLLVETDSPFLAPEPYRGRENEPAFVTCVVRAIAEARGLEPADVARAAMENARRLLMRGGSA